MTLKGKVVLISGASSGIGEALALEMAARGAHAIGLMARRVERLETLAERIRATGCQPLVIPADVVETDVVVAAVDQVIQKFGQIDVVVANAGIGQPHYKEARNLQAQLKVLDVNFLGAVRLCEAALPPMLERRSGQIVAVSSVAGWRGLPGSAAYSSSKAGLSCWMEAWHNELKGRGVEVTLIEPGFIRTEMTAANKFSMPFIQDVGDAARVMVGAIEAGARGCVTPWQYRYIMGLMRLMPNFLFDRLAVKVVPRKMIGEG